MYVALDRPDGSHAAPLIDDELTASTMLQAVLQHSGAELSGHQTITAEQEKWGSVAQLAAEYETVASAAQPGRWSDLVRRSGLTARQTEEAVTSRAFGPLAAALRRAEANGHDVEQFFVSLVGQHHLTDADDIAAVLKYRLGFATSDKASTSSQPVERWQHFIAGLIPEASGPMPQKERSALDQRKGLIEARVNALADAATAEGPRWWHHIGAPPAPTNSAVYRDWLTCIATIVAYRDRYQITSDLPLGTGARTGAERADRACALAAYRHAAEIASSTGPHRVEPSPSIARVIG